METTKKTLEDYRRLPYTLRMDFVTDSDKSSYWTAEYAELRGCKAEGNTEAEAVANLQELFDDYILAQMKMNVEIPEPAPLADVVTEVWTSYSRKQRIRRTLFSKEIENTQNTKTEVEYRKSERNLSKVAA